jgi:hypothetical protein
MIEPATRGVVVDHFLEGRYAAIVHVGRGDGDVSQRGRPEFSDVFRSVSLFVNATVGRFISGDAGIEETAALLFAVARKLAPVESNAPAEGPPPMTLKTASALARGKDKLSPLCRLRNCRGVPAPAVPVVRRSYGE